VTAAEPPGTSEPSLAGLHCECGAPADAVHLLDRGQPHHYPRAAEDVEARFSCPRHDHGGYYVMLAELDGGDWLRHLSEKSWRGDCALVRAGLLADDGRQRPPTVTATRHDSQLVVRCPWCGGQHRHGGGQCPGDGDGHRAAHCGAVTGYFIEERQ
jgi:hypothetical protein